ncbi:hypothetical protein RJ640_003836 [Escallonia rubra]|uniref:DUF4219 domain-containing protein n=1 Tax=Escallonia rubra TaxID=112253 RepID=A0AA88R8Y2_9ASTE|nr:hypothetical protein RJ640_003836 [Escallonia rubra]
MVFLVIPGLMYGRALISIARKMRDEYNKAGMEVASEAEPASLLRCLVFLIICLLMVEGAWNLDGKGPSNWDNFSHTDEFKYYADICFSRFGDRVKNWITLNEPWTFAAYGYDSGSMAPGRCSECMHLNCTGGDSATEPYQVTHNLILSHLAAVRLYRRDYEPRQEGRIGITLVAQWYLGPIVNGDYPDIMRELVPDRLPHFTDEQTQELKHSFDFLGMNYYTAFYVNNTPSNPKCVSYSTDSQALTSWSSLPHDSSVEATLDDTDRRDYISDHLCCLHQSIKGIRAEVLMAASSGAFPFPKLVKDNYERWSIQMKTFLGDQDVWEAIEEEYVEPENLACASQAVKKAAKEARVKDQKALSLIQLGVDDNIFLEDCAGHYREKSMGYVGKYF